MHLTHDCLSFAMNFCRTRKEEYLETTIVIHFNVIE